MNRESKVNFKPEIPIQQRILDLYENTDFALTLFKGLIGYAIIAADFDGSILAYNEGARLIYGYAPEEIIGKENIEIFFPKDFVEAGRLQDIINKLLDKERLSYEGEKVRKDGSKFPAQILFTLTKDENSRVVGFVEIVQDLTEQKRAEDTQKLLIEKLKASQLQLVQSEKMSALGTLAAGIAHEMFNPMMGILNFIQYCMKHEAKDSKQYAILKSTELEVIRCVDIVRNMLTFSHHGKKAAGEYQKENFVAIFERIFKLLSYRIEAENITLKLDFEKVPYNLAIGDDIQQVFLNILVNALDAVKESETKEISVSIRHKGEFVEAIISDTGCGIDPENIQKIYDPFFTTKPPGQGTGLGLSICHNSIKEHKGTITCESRLKAGTKFQILLPIERKEEVA